MNPMFQNLFLLENAIPIYEKALETTYVFKRKKSE